VDFSLGMKAIRKRDYVSTRDAFARGLVREPDNVEARISYARALYLTGDKPQAKQQLENALSRAPSNVLAQYLLGILTEEEGDVADATAYYQRVITQESAHAGANFYLANRYYRDGLLDKAAQHYATTIASDSGNLAAYLPYTGVLLQAGHKKAEILAMVEATQKRFPEQPVLRYLLIQLQACPDTRQGCDAGKALELASELAERQPLPPHRELLALATAASGDFTGAATIQQALVSEAVWMIPLEIERLSGGLAAYQDGKLPQPKELFTWQLLQAPPIHGVDVFRDYPTPKPY
jgi:tetratricopeptide (TPR) repeat protein